MVLKHTEKSKELLKQVLISSSYVVLVLGRSPTTGTLDWSENKNINRIINGRANKYPEMISQILKRSKTYANTVDLKYLDESEDSIRVRLVKARSGKAQDTGDKV
jgi:hypothetical protein